jgi:hypothetical protein
VHEVVVPLDVVEVDRVAEPRGLEQVARVAPQRRELDQLVAVALEVAVVDGVEADQGGEQPYVGLGDVVTDQVAPLGQPVLETVQRLEQPVVGPVVRPLPSGEAAAVDAVVHIGVHPGAHLVDLVAPLLRVELGRPLAVVGRPLQGQVDGDLREVVGHDLLGGDVDHRRDGDALGVVGVAREERLLQPLVAEHRVPTTRVEVEGPAPFVVRGTAHRHAEHFFEAEQTPYDDRAAGPRTGPGHHQPVPSRLDRPPVAAVGGDPVRDVVGVPVELLLDVLRHPSSRVVASSNQYLSGTSRNLPAAAGWAC